MIEILNNFKNCCIKLDLSIKEALKIMDKSGMQILLVVDNRDKLLGIITDGDFRRAIINSVNLTEPVENIMNRNYRFITDLYDKEEVINVFRNSRINHLVVLNDEKNVLSLIQRGGIIYKDQQKTDVMKKNYVVIMAGGKGSRLNPFTKILPKPMIPIGDKPIIELIMSRFYEYGFNNFMLSVNYKKEIIKMYFQDQNNINFNINYLEEDKPLGTIGSLSLALDLFDDTLIVTNCDAIIEVDYNHILEFHKDNKNDITIVGNLRNIKIPYGVINMEDGNFMSISEKPEYDLLVNAGLYYIEPNIISLIPRNMYYHVTELIASASKMGKKIGVYPTYCKWLDIGQWGEYKKTMAELGIV